MGELVPERVLSRLRGPRDLDTLTDHQLDTLAQEIRDVLVATLSRTGGHLGPNLGVVELSIAIHRVFDSPHDPVVFDTGHQAYVHKLLTGRLEQFDTIRQADGLSGYPSPEESEHDWVQNSHASTALSYADGMAKAFAVRGEHERTVVAVVGDGALTGGMAWEALNTIAASADSEPSRPLVMIVNDNGRSYSPTVGGLAAHLNGLRTDPRYERTLAAIKRRLSRTRLVGPPLYDALHGIKKGLKDVVAPQGMFEDLGLKYIGPVDGHDRAAVESALEQANGFRGPVIVHTVTEKGRGCEFALTEDTDLMHSPGPFDPRTGAPAAQRQQGWTNVFSDALVAAGHRRPDVVAITAAMPGPTGLVPFAEAYPQRCFDVGIAEQHATTSAAGMAMAGLHPVVAVYSTFLNRAFDQVLMDCALHECGVTFVLDRAGVTGDDGPSHNGMWDMSVLQVVPGLRIAAPRDATRLTELFDEALEVDDAPTVLRFPKGPVGEDITPVERLGGVDILAQGESPDVLLVAVGSMGELGVDTADRLAAQGLGVTVVDPRWVKPLPEELARLADEHRLVVCVEDNNRSGGVGSMVAQLLRDRDVTTPVREYGIPPMFLAHGKRAALLSQFGLTAQDIAREVSGVAAALKDSPELTDEPGQHDRG
ncbi:MAG TPA: 1-deoxy-D-xylulose-5-phosphate synthase [Jiangellaceae bacterium]|nr:1-deoxy-D-xylulose-5-phosphate synthase [Jiangellaceae bacterium]